MRQLVSVVTEETVSYYLADDGGDDEVVKVAQVLNDGLGVPEVIDLGANLVAALRLNGHRRKSVTAPAAKPLPEPAKPAKPAQAKPAQAKRPRVSWGLTGDRVLADIRAHPGTTFAEIAQRLTGSDDRRAVQSVTAHIHALSRTHHIARHRGANPSGAGMQVSYLTYEEPTAQAPTEQEQ